MSTAKKKEKHSQVDHEQTVMKFFTPTADKQIQRQPIRTPQEVKIIEMNAAKSTNGKRKNGLYI